MTHPLADESIVTVKDIAIFIGMVAFAYWQARVEAKRKDDAQKAIDERAKQQKDLEQIKTTVAETADTTNIIHKLSNNASGLLKRAKAVALRSLAVNTGDARDLDAAQVAEKEADDHDAHQVEIDAEIDRRADLALQVTESAKRKEIAENEQAVTDARRMPTAPPIGEQKAADQRAVESAKTAAAATQTKEVADDNADAAAKAAGKATGGQTP